MIFVGTDLAGMGVLATLSRGPNAPSGIPGKTNVGVEGRTGGRG
jgi:hypothetical protein